MFGLMIRQAKKHPSLIPLFSFISLGVSAATLYISRMALFSPDVSWDKKNNPEPWNKLDYNQQYKFIAVNTNYKHLTKNRPDY